MDTNDSAKDGNRSCSRRRDLRTSGPKSSSVKKIVRVRQRLTPDGVHPGAFPVQPEGTERDDDREGEIDHDLSFQEDEENGGKKPTENIGVSNNEDIDDEYASSALYTATEVDEGVAISTIGESERAEMKEQAAREAEDKVLSKMVRADIVESGTNQRRHKRRRFIFIVIGLTVVIGVIIGIFFIISGRSSEKSFSNNKELPTIAPTPYVDATNSSLTCENARDITDLVGEPIIGTTMEAWRQLKDRLGFNDIEACDVVEKNGAGVWLSLIGDGKTKVASTCDNTYFDTQISVFTGTCDQLQCVAGNDQMIVCGNGDQSTVAWKTVAGSRYFIRVHGHRRANGVFELLVRDCTLNDRCDDAAVLVPFETQFGTTRGSSVQSGEKFKCGESVPTSGGVWYRFVTPERPADSNAGFDFYTQMTILAETRGITSFRPHVSLFEGEDCNNLDCVQYGEQFVVWNVQYATTYQVLVYGLQGEGDFAIGIGDQSFFTEGHPEFRPITCPSSPILLPGDTVFGDTSTGQYLGNNACGRNLFNSNSGQWFRTIGTGSIMRASTCGTTSGFDTQISIYRGSCQEPECVAGNDQSIWCEGDQSSVTWFSTEGEMYFVFVHGYQRRVGSFNLTIDDEITSDVPLLSKGESCTDAVELPVDQDFVLGSFIGAPLSPAVDGGSPFCAADVSVPGLWYKIVSGTGQYLTVSACDGISSTALSLIVFAGIDCNNLVCVEDTITTPCGEQESVTWLSKKGEIYHILVQQGKSGSVGGERMLDRLLPTPPEEALTSSPPLEETFPPSDKYEGEGTSRFPPEIESGTQPEESIIVPERVVPNSSFTLYAGEVPENNECDGAIGPLQVSFFSEETRGSMWSATIDSNVELCYNSKEESIPTLGRGVWYTVVGTGLIMVAEVCSAETSAGMYIGIYTGDCEKRNLACVESQWHPSCGQDGGMAYWESEEGRLYFILVHGNGPAESSNFALKIGDQSRG